MSSGIEPTTVGQRIVNFLRRQHPTKTAINVHRDTGCSIAQVNKWLERTGVPNGVAMARMFFAYGPEFLVAISERAPGWCDADERARRQAVLETMQRHSAEMRRLLSER